jgi:hypothetical protein
MIRLCPLKMPMFWTGLPGTRSVLLDSGHFVWEDRAEDYAAAILGWIQGRYRAAQRRHMLSTAAAAAPLQNRKPESLEPGRSAVCQEAQFPARGERSWSAWGALAAVRAWPRRSR